MYGMQRTQFDHKRFDRLKFMRNSSAVNSQDRWFVTTLLLKFSPEHVVERLVIICRCNQSKSKQLYINFFWNLTRICVEICHLEFAKTYMHLFHHHVIPSPSFASLTGNCPPPPFPPRAFTQKAKAPGDHYWRLCIFAPAGFWSRSQTRGGTQAFLGCIHTRNFKNVRNV